MILIRGDPVAHFLARRKPRPGRAGCESDPVSRSLIDDITGLGWAVQAVGADLSHAPLRRKYQG